VDVNGLKPEVLPPSLSTLLTNGEIDDNLYSYESNSRNYDSETSGPENDLRYICINNNNNTVIEEEKELIPLTPPEPPTPFINSKENKSLVVIIFQSPATMECDDLQIDSLAWLNCNDVRV
jgi:hypothetical protein